MESRFCRYSGYSASKESLRFDGGDGGVFRV
jgi:hypothetical protein